MLIPFIAQTTTIKELLWNWGLDIVFWGNYNSPKVMLHPSYVSMGIKKVAMKYNKFLHFATTQST